MKHQHLRMALALAIAGAAQAQADAVLDWNAIAAQTILASGRPGPSTVIDFAVVQATVHDAVQAYDKDSSRTLPKSPARAVHPLPPSPKPLAMSW